MLDRVSDDEYDARLASSVVFLALDGAPANTTVVECIARNTPVMVNRLPGVVEYLGTTTHFTTICSEEAAHKLNDLALIRGAQHLLAAVSDETEAHPDHFLASIQNSAIYRQLPIPQSQATGDSRRYDVSVVICSYKRVYNMDGLLELFCQQDFSGTFELLIWNNNYAARPELEVLYGKYRDRLNLNVIHSTENFYCVIRLAMASLIRRKSF